MEVSSQTVNTVNVCPRAGLILIQHQKEGFTQAIQHRYEPAATEMDCLRAAQVIEAISNQHQQERQFNWSLWVFRGG